MIIKILNYLFGWEYVLLRTIMGNTYESRVNIYFDKYFGTVHSSKKRLMPDGKVLNGDYVMEWYPITPGIVIFYNSKTMRDKTK